MKRRILGLCLASLGLMPFGLSQADAQNLVVQQTSPRNILYVVQQRSPFHTRSSTITATSGRTTVTEIVAIGPDPVPLNALQSGALNRATIYQLGTAPSLDISQQGAVSILRSKQIVMP